MTKNAIIAGRRREKRRWGKFAFLLVLSVLLARNGLKTIPCEAHDFGTRRLVICGGGEFPPAARDRFLEWSGGKNGKLVVVPTAAADTELVNEDAFLKTWSQAGLASVTVRHTRSRETADSEDFVAPLRQATAVWFGGGQQSRLAEAYVGTAFERELLALLDRGGVVGGSSAGAAIQSKLMITGGNPLAELGVGFDLLPNAVIDQHFTQRDRVTRLTGVLREHAGLVGYGVDEDTALLVHGRHAEVVGMHHVTVCLAPGAGRPAIKQLIPAGQSLDLEQWRRAAMERTRSSFPPAKPAATEVPTGALVIGGGGRLPETVLTRFIELAGGPEAPIVVLPTASDAIQPNGDAERRMFEKAGAKRITVLAGRSRAEVESPAALEALDSARGVWFGGGRQWRFVDAYAETEALTRLHGVLRRGGVIGGSSAGASIQAEYLVRGSPLGNRDMSAEGYERGFAFLPGTAIDQHFTQRRRHDDLRQLIDRFPQLLGIGIDEGTVLIVRGQQAEVLGDHDVYFDDRSAWTPGSPLPDLVKVRPGESFNLRTRK